MALDQHVKLGLVEIAPRRFENPRLGLGNRIRAVCEQVLDDPCALILKPGERHNLVYEPNTTSFLGVEALSGQRIAA